MVSSAHVRKLKITSNSSFRGPDSFYGLPGKLHTVFTYTDAHTYIKKILRAIYPR